MIFTQGGNTGGWALYLKDGQLVAAHNFLDVNVYSVKSGAAIKAGDHDVRDELLNTSAARNSGRAGT